MQIIKKFKESVLEVKNVYPLTVVAMLLALRIVLGFFANATLPAFGNNIKITAAFLPIAVTGVMFGPFPAAVVGALGDVISYLLNPMGLGFFPGFTISGILTGLIYGFAFYKNNVTLPRVIIARIINMIAVETFLAAYWLYLLNGGGASEIYLTYLIPRIISELIKCVPEMLLIFGVGKLVTKITIPNRLKKEK